VCQIVCQQLATQHDLSCDPSDLLGESGEPNVRQLEPDGRVAEAGGGPSADGVIVIFTGSSDGKTTTPQRSDLQARVKDHLV